MCVEGNVTQRCLRSCAWSRDVRVGGAAADTYGSRPNPVLLPAGSCPATANPKLLQLPSGWQKNDLLFAAPKKNLSQRLPACQLCRDNGEKNQGYMNKAHSRGIFSFSLIFFAAVEPRREQGLATATAPTFVHALDRHNGIRNVPVWSHSPGLCGPGTREARLPARLLRRGPSSHARRRERPRCIRDCQRPRACSELLLPPRSCHRTAAADHSCRKHRLLAAGRPQFQAAAISPACQD